MQKTEKQFYFNEIADQVRKDGELGWGRGIGEMVGLGSWIGDGELVGWWDGLIGEMVR